MKNIFSRINYMLLFVILVFILISPSCWGERAFPIEFDNQTDMILSIFIDDTMEGIVKPNETIAVRYFPGKYSYTVIVAKNTSGETVFSKTTYLRDLDKIHRKVVILPSGMVIP